MPAEPGRMPRVLVIGCGSIGKRHLRNLLALGVRELVAIDPRPERCEEAAALGVEALTDLAAAWIRRPDAVVIATPTNRHVPLAIEAAQHGCHLFIEKPLADRLDGIEELIRAVESRHLVTLVGCNLRFHPGLLKVKDLLVQSAVGRVVAIRIEAGQYLPDWHPWEDYRLGDSARRESGGGVMLDAIHELDYARWLLGEVQAVACFSGTLSRLEIETEDTAALLLQFASGVLGEVHLDYVQRAYSRGCQVIGDEGTIRWDYAAGEVRWFSALSGAWQVWTDPASWEPNQMYQEEIRHWLRCLRGEEPPAQDLREGLAVLELALAAKRSAERGEVVRTLLPAAAANGTGR